jgi:hypothetical protein
MPTVKLYIGSVVQTSVVTLGGITVDSSTITADSTTITTDTE